MFTKYITTQPINLFEQLRQACIFEALSDNRQGAILVCHNVEEQLIPIVRTTTRHKLQSQPFADIHHHLVRDVRSVTGIQSLDFNNAMAEIYDPTYIKMSYHTDQALDLAVDSWICLFSCYEDPNEPFPRKLVVKDKESQAVSEHTLDHGSCILFSASDNAGNLHKIVAGKDRSRGRWLGVTFRLSRTFVKEDVEGRFWFADSLKELTMATETEKREMYRLKKLENASVRFAYPEITYTLSRP